MSAWQCVSIAILMTVTPRTLPSLQVLYWTDRQTDRQTVSKQRLSVISFTVTELLFVTRHDSVTATALKLHQSIFVITN